MKVVFFAHGKESGPWGTKIRALAEIARGKGWSVESPDYSGVPDPDERVNMLLERFGPGAEKVALVGSSMGGYVATVASATIAPSGLFLMAPAFYLPGYRVMNPVPAAGRTLVVHGWRDTVVTPINSIGFAHRHSAQLHMVDADHQLLEAMDFIEKLFAWFLDTLD